VLPDKATIWVAGADETAYGTPFWKVGVHDPPPLCALRLHHPCALPRLVLWQAVGAYEMRSQKGCGGVSRCATGEVTVRQKGSPEVGGCDSG
jgi:hypothetical protein